MMIHVHVRVSLNLTAHWPKKEEHIENNSQASRIRASEIEAVSTRPTSEREKKMKTENAVR